AAPTPRVLDERGDRRPATARPLRRGRRRCTAPRTTPSPMPCRLGFSPAARTSADLERRVRFPVVREPPHRCGCDGVRRGPRREASAATSRLFLKLRRARDESDRRRTTWRRNRRVQMATTAARTRWSRGVVGAVAFSALALAGTAVMTTSPSVSASEIPDGSVFIPIEPHRLFDSRSGLGLEEGAGQFAANSTTIVAVVGSTVPTGAVGIVMNLTSVNSRDTGYVT